MRSIEPGSIPTRDFHQYLLGVVAPRPIAFVSTLGEDGVANLAPYSFYNAFSSNPPILVFSSNRRVSNNTTKDTLANVIEQGECVINAVNYSIVHQMAVTSVEFPEEVSEFEKAGLTPIPSEKVKPFRVKESPAQMECKVKDIITLGEHGGAGHLVICEVVMMHISEQVMDSSHPDRIDPHKIDLMGRMGRAYYTRASGSSIYTIVQPVTKLTIGYDALPESVRRSAILSANNIGQLAGLHALPTEDELQQFQESDVRLQAAMESTDPKHTLHLYAKELLATDERTKAATALLIADQL